MKKRLTQLDGEDAFLTPFSKICSFCVHFNAEGLGRTCSAFPEGIPNEIWLGRNDHKEPYPGDNGIQFETKKAD